MTVFGKPLGALRPGSGPEISLGQGPPQQPPQQHRVLQQLQQGDWRLQQLHLQPRHPHQQPQQHQDAYVQQVILLVLHIRKSGAWWEIHAAFEYHCIPFRAIGALNSRSK